MIRVIVITVAALLLTGLLGADKANAQGAPYCVATSYGEQCQYYSRASCDQAAARARGACVLNQNEMARRQQSQPQAAPSSSAPFCVVTSYGNNCWYHSADACQAAAARVRGTCVYNR
jgi:hypothetical protein